MNINNLEFNNKLAQTVNFNGFNAVKVLFNGIVVYEKQETPFNPDEWIKFTALDNETSIKYELHGNADDEMVYALDESGTVYDWAEGMGISLLHAGDYVYVKNNKPDSEHNYQTGSYLNFVMDMAHAESEHLEHRIKCEFASLNPIHTPGNYCYWNLFSGCKSLVEVSDLPMTELFTGCYYGMFNNTGLVNAPELPATEAKYKCYYGMFEGCTSLVNAPELPATTLATECYNQMFYGCTSLVNAPELPAENIAEHAYERMFYNCNKLKMIVCNALTYNGVTITTTIGYQWVYGVSSIGTFYKNPDWDGPTYRGSNSIITTWNLLDIGDRIDKNASYYSYSNQPGWLTENTAAFTGESALNKHSIEKWNSFYFVKFVSINTTFNAGDNIILNAFTRTFSSGYTPDNQLPVRISLYAYDALNNLVYSEDSYMKNIFDWYYTTRPSSGSWSTYNNMYIPNNMVAFNYVLANTNVDDETGYTNKFTIPQNIENGHIEIVIAFVDLTGKGGSWLITESKPWIGTPGNYTQLVGKSWS